MQHATPADTFAQCSNENEKTRDVLVVAIDAMQRANRLHASENKKRLTILDCGTGNGRYTSALVDSIAATGASFLPMDVYGLEIDPESIEESRKNYAESKAAFSHVIRCNFFDESKTGIREALGWEVPDSMYDAVDTADVLLLNHVGYYLDGDEAISDTERRSTQWNILTGQSRNLIREKRKDAFFAKLADLTAPYGMMVFIHSDGKSEFDTLRALLEKRIHQNNRAMERTYRDLPPRIRTLGLSSFDVHIPCYLHLPHDEKALHAAWFGENTDGFTEKEREHVAIFNNILCFAGDNAPIEDLRQHFTLERKQEIWDDFWHPLLERSRGESHLAMQVGGGKMTFVFGRFQLPLARIVRAAISTALEGTGATVQTPAIDISPRVGGYVDVRRPQSLVDKYQGR